MLRIITGKYAGRKIPLCKGFRGRPTMGRVRSSIFNALSSRVSFYDAIILDLFCGTGAFSFEAVSRGASKSYLIDKSHKSLKHIKKLSIEFGIEQFELIRGDVLRIPLVARSCCDIVFMDPPFFENLIPSSLFRLSKSDWISKDTIIVVECSIHDDIEEVFERYKVLRVGRYGSVKSYFLSLR